jgi:hypothetical protein
MSLLTAEPIRHGMIYCSLPSYNHYSLNHMRLLIKFAKEFEHDDIEKDVDSHETIDNLSVQPICNLGPY